MTWLLTAKTGPNRGESWTIGNRPLVLGRSLSCDITVGDPTVSRKHCEVRLEGDAVHFRDLGSRNISLVNGRPAESCRLLVGDELSVGAESFILTRTTVPVVVDQPVSDSKSATLSLDEALYIKEASVSPSSAPAHPTTVGDLVRLYHFGRRLGGGRTEAELVSLCLSELEDAFPARVKVAVCCASMTGLIWYPAGFSPTEHLLRQVFEALQTGEAILSSFRSKRLFFRELAIAGVAPLMVSGRACGAFVIQSIAREYIPESSALSLLRALAQTASPYFGSIEQHNHPTPDVTSFRYGTRVEFVGGSPAVEALREEIAAAARWTEPVFITGEAGTGKELAAHLIHNEGAAPHGPIVSTSCLTLAGAHFMRALAGSATGTGGGGAIRGLFGQAAGGTLLLREISALTRANQAELLGVLRSGMYTPEDGGTAEPLKCRIICTSSRDIERAIEAGNLDRELVEHIGGIRIHINPLRQRPSDIPTLAKHFLASDQDATGRPLGLTEEAVSYLKRLPLRGNARELQSTLARAARQGATRWIGLREIEKALRGDGDPQTELAPLEKAERTLIQAVLTHCEGNVHTAADVLGIPVSVLESLRESAGTNSTPAPQGHSNSSSSG